MCAPCAAATAAIESRRVAGGARLPSRPCAAGVAPVCNASQLGSELVGSSARIRSTSQREPSSEHMLLEAALKSGCTMRPATWPGPRLELGLGLGLGFGLGFGFAVRVG